MPVERRNLYGGKVLKSSVTLNISLLYFYYLIFDNFIHTYCVYINFLLVFVFVFISDHYRNPQLVKKAENK